jgi:serine/threonine-protein kinase
VPVELDTICARATALEASDRFPSARAMHEAIEQYLEGVRDVEHRKRLAGEHLGQAKAALARTGASVEGQRVEALRHLARAVVLDPEDPTTLKSVLEIVIAPADDLPIEARRELEADETKARTRAAGLVARGQLIWFAVALAILMVGIRSWPIYAGLIAAVLGAAAAGFATSSWGARGIRPHLLVVTAFVAVAMSAFTVGAFTFTAGLAGAMASSLCTALRTRGGMRRLVLALAVASVFVPVALVYAGVVPDPYTYGGDTLTIKAVLMSFPPVLTPVLLALASLAQMLIPALIAGAGVDALLDAERRSFAQAWRLRQMLPRGA